ncbi:hypothetical protein [Actinocrispum wychmicini]|uniref:Uncharacterized protein n=1 Tax=Actinocrispum wychmicini TaxID=1213861 RepID=A0A4R2J7H3_9PSEU|nr:hypothetical protein [Actinocrispum wychmicini]TCO54087.1 hypothetical protein EV192_10967 [Actinocrispum wychmicini]
MKLTLEQVPTDDGDKVVVRLVLLNDTYDTVMLDRSLLIGPNPVAAHPTGLPLPISLEPPLSDNTVVLNPWCLYGRQRTFDAAGEMTFHAYLLREHTDQLRPDGPVDAALVDIVTVPLTIR